MAQGAVEYAKELGANIPIVLHLDHGDTFELCKSCIDMGFSSVMIDGSHFSFDENIELTKKVRLLLTHMPTMLQLRESLEFLPVLRMKFRQSTTPTHNRKKLRSL